MRFEKKDIQGIVLIVGSLTIILTIIATSLILKYGLQYDPDTFCPKEGDYPHTIVVIDKTDPFTSSQRRFIHNLISDIGDELRHREKLTIIVLTADNYIASAPVFSKCNPGTGDEANELYQNPRKIQKKFDEFFQAPLDSVLEDILSQASSRSSPILEMMREISYRKDFKPEKSGKRLIIVSDMIQHMPEYSQYTGNIDYDIFSNLPYAGTVTASLSGVKVHIIYLWRPKYRSIQGKNHLKFWERFFQDMSAEIVEVRRIP